MSKNNPITRRALCIGVGATAVMAALGSLQYVGSQPLVRPPGGQNEVNLTSKCIHCYRCIEVCPQHVVTAAPIDTGVLNMRTPRMEYSNCPPGQLDALRYCDSCVNTNNGVPLCAEVCPTGALDPLDASHAQQAVLGVAVLNTQTCIAYRSSFCAFCHDACIEARGEDQAAIYYINADAQDAASTRLPVVDPQKCNGCGACEAVCVSAQAGSTKDASQRAIIVQPLDL